MSAATEQRAWQRPRNSQAQRSSNNNSPAPTNTSGKPATPATTANVWAQRAEKEKEQRSRSSSQKPTGSAASKDSGAKDNVQKVVSEAAATSTATTASNQTKHVPINGFNSEAVRKFLLSGSKPVSYKPTNAAASSISKSKSPGQMADGQDFFVQLRKQVAAIKGKQQ